MEESYKIFVDKLNNFRKRFYFYKLLRGFIISIVLFIALYTVISIIEYYTYSSQTIRKIEFFGLIIFFTLVLSHFVFTPLYQLLKKLDKREKTNLNALIVSHFSEIKDKLINVLELAEESNNQYSNEIVAASIQQKINELRIFDFNKAVNFYHLKYIGLYLIITLITVTSIVIFEKPLLKESNYRIINYKQPFSKPAPYIFIFEEDSLKISKGENVTLTVECKGEKLPEVVYMNIGGNNFLMQKIERGVFNYKLDAVINTFSFYFTDLVYSSKQYYLKTLPKPGIQNFNIEIKPPTYTGIADQVASNIGDVKVPEGTLLKWAFNCIDTDSLLMHYKDEISIPAIQKDKLFHVEKKVLFENQYSIDLVNEYFKEENAISYSISVIKDLYPEIDVVQIRDSSQYSRFYFKGSISDDYGFSGLHFHYNINENDSVIPVRFIKSLNEQEYYFTFDFKEVSIPSGLINYYFSVNDNDEVNGFKTTTSNSFTYKIPNSEELASMENEKFKEIENLMEKGQNLAQEIRNNVKELQLNTINNNLSDWEKSQLINDIGQQQQQLENLLKDAFEQNKDLNNMMNTFSEENQELLEKQEQIQQLLDEVLTQELKDLLEEFYKLAEEFDENKLNKLSQQLDMSFDDLSKQLDRNLEMLKKMKVEQALQNLIDNLVNVGQNEEKLAEEVIQNKNYERILEKDTRNKKQIENVQDQLDNTLDINKGLKKPLNFNNFEHEFNDIKKGFEQNKIELEKKNKNKSSRSIKETSERIKNLAFNMQQMLQTNTMQQNMESIANLKQILSNLLYLSFTQEEILSQLKGVDTEDPVLKLLKRQQNELVNQSSIIKDSLYALANRTPQINNLVSNELLDMELNLSNSNSRLEENRIPQAIEKQQFVITSSNNLALLLDDILGQIQNQMANAMPGDQQCENPKGKGGDQLDMLKNSSQGMKEQLQQMIEEMKKGNSKQMSKMLGESLMQHEMMQKMLRDLMQNGQVGSSALEQLKEIDKILEQNRRDLMNKNITPFTINRHNKILTRLLEAENAEMERDIDEKRESQTVDEEFFSNPLKYFEYNKNNQNNIEQLKYNNHNINSYYTKKYQSYLKTLENISIEK